MRKLTLAAAAVFAAVNAAQAATTEAVSAELEKAGFTISVGSHQQPPKPGVPQPVYNHPTHPTYSTQPTHPAHPTHPVNPGHPANPAHHVYPPPQPGHPVYPPPQPGYPTQPWNPGYPVQPGHPTQPWYPGQPAHPVYPPPQPGYPTNPWNPGYPPAVQTQQFRFESGAFVFQSDAKRSMENAADALRRAGYTLLEKRNNFTSYTLVFLAPSYLKIEKYQSGAFVFQSEAQKAADDCVRAMQAQGKTVLERNVSGTSFTVSYLGYGASGYMQTQTYTSGAFVFQSEASKSMNEAVAALKNLNAVILEKRLRGNSYTIVFQAPHRLEFQTYASGAFVYGSDASRSMADTAAALQGVRGFAVVEKRLSGNSYNVVFLAPFRVEFQKYVSGVYTFSSEAQRAAAETAAAFASQGLRVVEKNVSGTQFTITYFLPGYYY